MGLQRVGHDWVTELRTDDNKEFCLNTMMWSSLTYILGLVICGRRRRQWHPTPVPLPGKSHGWRSLVGCSPWGRKELDTTERLHFHFSLSCIGEGNGNPLQCLAWSIPGMGEPCGLPSMGLHSRTRLKWLSSSSSICGRKILMKSLMPYSLPQLKLEGLE